MSEAFLNFIFNEAIDSERIENRITRAGCKDFEADCLQCNQPEVRWIIGKNEDMGSV